MKRQWIIEAKGRGDSSLFCFTGNLSYFPEKWRKGAGNEVPCWGLGRSPKRVWAAAQRNPISKRDVVSEQNAEHSAIETGSSRNKHVGTPKPTAVREQSETWRWISANFSIRRKRLKLCIFPTISKENAAFIPQKPAFGWKTIKKCQKKIKKRVDTGTKSRYNNWAVSASH